MSEFLFKRFKVISEESAMKVNTDGVLLGAYMNLCGKEKRLLDIGTGTGTIALMAAQRMSDMISNEQYRIDAIDIDEPSAKEAKKNFEASPWNNILMCTQISLNDYHPDSEIDMIFSNPPYFDNSLTNPSKRETQARHCVSLSYREIVEFSEKYLSRDGHLALILPSEEEKALLRHGRGYGLYPERILRIRTTPRKNFRRIIVEFGKIKCELKEDCLTIQENSTYTEEYLSLVKDFYLFA